MATGSSGAPAAPRSTARQHRWQGTPPAGRTPIIVIITVRLRTRKTKGSGSRAAGLAMAYKLLDAAQARWRCVNAPHLVALVRAGATFVHGFLIEREDQRYAA